VRKLIVGLGNPGPEYARTRHNIGFLCLAELAERHGLRLARGRSHAETTTGQIAGQAVVLARPQTYMNESGRAVAALAAYYGVAPADLIVVYDDLDLPFGHLRLRAAGSAGGHNGLRSIIAHLHRDEIARLRIGVGRPPGQMPAERYVLLPFAPAERERLPQLLGAAADALECWLRDGLEAAMNRYNGWSTDAPERPNS
jgi:PTH1 family peptidyl-tRNA hydrolase